MTYQPSVRRRARPVSHCCLAAAMAAVFAILAGGALAAADYPTKPVRVFVPYGPGGVGDLTMRFLADKLGEQLKQQFVIENRPGAGGIVSATQVLRAAADGYTLGEIGNGQSISASLFKKLPFDVLKDFTSVSVAASFEMLLAVPGNSPYKSLKDMVDAAKKNPGKLNLGAINPGSTQNLSAHLFQQVTGAQFTIVTYRTTPDLVTALLRGDVDLGFDYYAGFISEIGRRKTPDRRHLGRGTRSLAERHSDREGKRLPAICRHQLERGRGARRPAGRDRATSLTAEINRALAARTFRKRRAVSASMRAPARRSKCTTAWRPTSPSGGTLSTKPEFQNSSAH